MKKCGSGKASYEGSKVDKKEDRKVGEGSVKDKKMDKKASGKKPSEARR